MTLRSSEAILSIKVIMFISILKKKHCHFQVEACSSREHCSGKSSAITRFVASGLKKTVAMISFFD